MALVWSPPIARKAALLPFITALLVLMTAGALVVFMLPGAVAHEGDEEHADHMQGWSHAWMAFWMVLGLFLLIAFALFLGYWLSRRPGDRLAPSRSYDQFRERP